MKLHNKYLIPVLFMAVGTLDLLIPSVWFLCMYFGIIGLIISQIPKRINKSMAFPVNGIIKAISTTDDKSTEIIVETMPIVHSTVFRFIDKSVQTINDAEVLYESGIKITHIPSIYAQMFNDESGSVYGYSLGPCTTKIELPNTITLNPELVQGMIVIDGETSLISN